MALLPTQGGKPRLDAYLAGRLPDTSRARVAASIKAGQVILNGTPCTKPSALLQGGDTISATLLPLPPCCVSGVCGG